MIPITAKGIVKAITSGGRGGGGRGGSWAQQRPDVAENISRLLLDPGPDLLIVDEAHATGLYGERGSGLIEAFGDESGIELTGAGSWTLKKSQRECGAEPDECYIVGPPGKEVPDFAIEVVWTSGGLDKLEIYRRLGVPEVWIWQEGRIDVWRLGADGYTPGTSSRVLPDLDLEMLGRYLDRPLQTAAVREYRAALRALRG